MNSVYKLLIQITGKDKGAKRELNKTKRSVKGLGSEVNAMKAAFAAAGATMSIHFAKQIAEAAWEMGRAGAEAQRMSDSFDKLAGRIDTTGDALLRSLKSAASGTVSDMDLMRTTAGLLASGIQTSTGDITDAMEIARLKAQQFGLTTTEAYNRMVTGARKFSVEMLDEIGINLKAESVYRRKAEAMGVATSALTDAQRAESLWQAILEDGRAEIEQYGGAVDDMATDIERATVAIENARLAAQIAMAPITADFAEMIPGAIARLELLGAVMEGVISLQTYWTAAGEAQRIEQTKGIDAAESYINQVIRTGEVVALATNVHGEWANALGQLPGDVAQANTALEGHVTVLQRVASAYIAIAGLPQVVLDLDPRAADAWQHLMDTRERAEEEWIENSMDRLHGFEDANEDTARSVGRTWQDEYARLRSAVESALTPTVVTDLDMELTELGQYVDKWDENARRLDAVAEAGFAAFDAHPDWVEILKIPDNVLASGEEGLKSWARQTAASVRDLTRPDLLNIDAAVAAVEQYFADMAARELSIDLVTEALVAKGVVSGADAKKQVAQALGLDQTIVGEEAGSEIFQGMIDKFSEKSAATEFAGYLSKDVVDQAIQLRGAGYELWITTEVGILDAMEEGNYVQRWVDLLLPALLAALGEYGQWTGGGKP